MTDLVKRAFAKLQRCEDIIRNKGLTDLDARSLRMCFAELLMREEDNNKHRSPRWTTVSRPRPLGSRLRLRTQRNGSGLRTELASVAIQEPELP